MIELDINPFQIGIWCPYIKISTFSLEEIILKEGWINVPRVPIFELPKGYLHNYILIDGHGRHKIAKKTNTFLPCNLYVPGEFIDVEKDNLAPFKYSNKSLDSDFYQRLVLGYEILQKQ